VKLNLYKHPLVVNFFDKESKDTYPPEGNNIGDACDCEGDCDCNGGVDAADIAKLFLAH
jgi:hypothetical protein